MTAARDSLVRYRDGLSSGCSASGEPISHSNIPLVCRSKILVEMDWLGLSFTEGKSLNYWLGFIFQYLMFYSLMWSHGFTAGLTGSTLVPMPITN